MQNKPIHDYRNDQYVKALRNDLLKSDVVKDYYERSEKIDKRLSFEQFVEEYLIEIHTNIRDYNIKK